MSTTDVSKAEMIAYTVDKAVDDLHSFDLDNKAYMGVVRSLAFNLKRNEVRKKRLLPKVSYLHTKYEKLNHKPTLNQSLRSDLLSGVLTTKLLVTLTPEDLATDELRKARQSINVEDRESRRTDWLEEHKGKIQVK